MKRIAVGVEYDGTAFFGWQVQKHSENTVQHHVEVALSTVANSPVKVICAGRTDSGVHATEQVIHFDTDVLRNPRQWVYGANVNLPKSICLLWATPIEDDFHARFSAIRRRYRYVIINRSIRPTFLAYRTTWEYRPLDVERMQMAAKTLVGTHDFNAYRAQGCQAKSPVRTISQLQVSRQDHFIFIDIEANAFLHHMVRNIAGVLMDIGAGKEPVEWAKTILESKNRSCGGVTAPPHGLYLTGVDYPEEFSLPRLPSSSPVW